MLSTLRLPEKIELTLIPFVVLTVWFYSRALPATSNLGNLCLIFASLFLLQSLVRDLWLWSRHRLTPVDQRSAPEVRPCMCVESLIGLTGVILGLTLLCAGGGQFFRFSTPAFLWPVLTTVVLVGGFLQKDFVYDWAARRIVREPDHLNILPRWK